MGTKATEKNHFVETARDLGLDTDEANEAFERAFGKIAPPKRKPKPSREKTAEQSDQGD